MVPSVLALMLQAETVANAANNNSSKIGLTGLMDTIISEWILPIYIAAVGIGILFFLKDQQFGKMLLFIAIAAVVGVLLAGTGLLSSVSEDTISATEESESMASPPVDNQEVEPNAAPATPAEPLDWQPLLNVLVIVIPIFAVSAALYFITRGVRTRNEKRAQEQQRQDALTAEWDAVRQRYQKLLNTIASYETDISLAIRYPVMNDASEPATYTMLKHLHRAKDVRAAVQDNGIGGDDALMQRFSDVIAELSLSVENAEARAKHIALSNLSMIDRKDFEQAQLLLTHAIDEGNTESMRDNYVQRLKIVIDRINDRNKKHVVPQQSLIAIENIKLLELSAV